MPQSLDSTELEAEVRNQLRETMFTVGFEPLTKRLDNTMFTIDEESGDAGIYISGGLRNDYYSARTMTIEAFTQTDVDKTEKIPLAVYNRLVEKVRT